MEISERFLPLATAALEMIDDGSVVGLGTGRAATAFIHVLARRVLQGLNVRAVPTSNATAGIARRLGIPLVTLEDVECVDVAVDGADEVDPRGDMIKGKGGALVREKIVAAAARRLVILVGSEKLVPALGSHGLLPVEIVPFALGPCRRRLESLGYPATLRQTEGRPFTSDNGNLILDCCVPVLTDPAATDRMLREIPGVVATGLFIGMRPKVLIQDGESVRNLDDSPGKRDTRI